MVTTLSPSAGFASQKVDHPPPSGTSTNPAPPDSDALRDRTSLAIAGRPLREALRAASRTGRVDLKAAPDVGEQRVSLLLSYEPLNVMMRRLTELLSHSPDHPEGYHWQKLAREPAARPAYLLWRDQRSRDHERAELDRPRLMAARSLRSFRDAILHPDAPTDPAKLPFNSTWLQDEDAQPFRDAVKGLTDAQIDALMAGESIALDPSLFKDQIAAYRDEWYQRMNAQSAQAAAAGRPNPFPDGIPAPPFQTPSIAVRAQDEDGFTPSASTSFNIHLQGVSTAAQGETALYLSPLDDKLSPFVGPKDSYQKIYDLAPVFLAKTVTARERGDMGFTLKALSRVTKVIVYQEYFLKADRNDEWPAGPPLLKGTLPELINGICEAWGYTAVYKDGAYYFWSRHWSQDRAADISQPVLDSWSARLKARGYLGLADRVEMSSSMSWSQAALTLKMAIPEGAPGSKEEYLALRFLGSLTPEQSAASASAAGLPLASLSSAQQVFLVRELGPEMPAVSGDDLNAARAYVQVHGWAPAGMPHRVAVQLEIRTGDRNLFGTRFAFRDVPLEVPRDRPRTGAASPQQKAVLPAAQ